MERGGGEMAAKVEAGLIKDLTDLAPDTIDTISATAAAYELDGRTYALPFSIGLVGFWYNTDLFDEAGVEPPTTMDELYDVIDGLKAADIETDLGRSSGRLAGSALLVLLRGASVLGGGSGNGHGRHGPLRRVLHARRRGPAGPH